MDYLPIHEHGIIGDLHSIALVGTDGRIDWYCCPRFDSPSVFGAILDKDKGGFYRIAPVVDDWVPKQLYLPDTNVLITRFLTPAGVGEVQDFMPISEGASEHRHRLIRRVLGVRGEMRFRVDVQPRFDYGREKHETIFHEAGVLFRSPQISLALETRVPMDFAQDGAYGEFTLRPGETATFVLEQVPETYVPRKYSEGETREAFEETVRYWRRWLSQCRYQGRWREIIYRSALTLKLMTYRPTGAIVAAPTTSLPEHIGGVRNYDYRYTWIRDAAFSLYALLRLGFTEEASAFMEWLTERFREERPAGAGPLQIMYGIDGAPELEEVILEHLEGYRGSKPVRIGNAAADQLQLDIYGELIDSVYIYNNHANPIAHRSWMDLTRIVDWVCENWDQAGRGDLGGARRAPALHVLAADVLGRDRARGADRDPARPAGRALPVAAVPRRDLPPDHGARLERGEAGLRPALRRRHARRQRPRHAARQVHRAHRPAVGVDAPGDLRRPRLRLARLPLRRRQVAGRAGGG